ncbi:hypothetical protein GQ53DRAFT_411291 [Thozetella sp. PMI_491]|nr:hypothetical protein GQ53DRAFT_411291 [Thozetella sp. PMI_491]
MRGRGGWDEGGGFFGCRKKAGEGRAPGHADNEISCKRWSNDAAGNGRRLSTTTICRLPAYQPQQRRKSVHGWVEYVRTPTGKSRKVCRTRKARQVAGETGETDNGRPRAAGGRRCGRSVCPEGKMLRWASACGQEPQGPPPPPPSFLLPQPPFISWKVRAQRRQRHETLPGPTGVRDHAASSLPTLLGGHRRGGPR